MRWDRDYSSSDVEDRRSEGGAGLGSSFGGFGGGGGMYLLVRALSMFGWKGMLVGLIIAGLVMASGRCANLGSPTSPSSSGQSSVPAETASGRPVQASPEEQELVRFVGFVFDDIQKSWRKQLPDYQTARLVLFRRAVRSACGTASTAVGPFYCQLDNKVYIDLSFYDELRRRFGAPGDFAQAYVIAHEVGHHVQNLRRLLGKGDVDSVRVELQADCLAGAWAKDAGARNLLETGDIDEALNAASSIGDDTLQKKSQGYVQPEKFTHGSSAQRRAAFDKGYGGGVEACW
jgi:predicted metalloprotease